MLLVMPHAGKASSTSSRPNTKAPGPEYSYLDTFRKTFEDLIDTAKEKDDEKVREAGRRVGALTSRLRETCIAMHSAVFFFGYDIFLFAIPLPPLTSSVPFRNAYFALGNREEDETAAYAEAEMLRKQILHADESQALEVVEKLQTRLSTRRIEAEDIIFKETGEQPGLQTKNLFETIANLTDQTNRIGEIMLQWRASE